MALLFDEAQGAFKDTGSQTSPMKKSTGLMRKQMSKMDEVAPRGHTLAYITPEEAQILNRGGGGIDAQGNQMTGPYGVPMYPGYGSRGYRGAGKASGGDIGYGSQSNQASNDRSQQKNYGFDESGGFIGEGWGGNPPPAPAPPAPPPTEFVDRQKKSREAKTNEQMEKAAKLKQTMTSDEAYKIPKTEAQIREERDKEAQALIDRLNKEAQTKTEDDETPMDSGEFLKEWWKKRELEKKQLLPVEKPEIRIAEFNPDRLNKKLGNMIGGIYGSWLLWNPSDLGNLNSSYGIEIDKILSDREKGVGILHWKGGVSKDIIEFLQENAPENESQKQQMINMLNKLPQNVQDNIKKAVSEGELSFDVVSVKPFMDGVTKLASGDLIINELPDEFQVATTGSLRGLL